MKKILVPVDFSSHTDISCHYALSIAKDTGAELILFHSFFDQVYFTDGGFSTSFESGIMLTDEIILDFYKQKESLLKSIVDGLLSSLNPEDREQIKISSYMESGDPEVQIISAIQKHKPDLIIMGSTGMGKKSIFSGSVARRIIDHTNIPVLAVPAGADKGKIHNIAYMSVFDKNDPEAIRDIEALFSGFDFNLIILHINTDQDKNEQFDMLRQSLVKNNIDLIAFIPHKRNAFMNLFHRGITREDLFLTQIPILATRPAGRS